MICGRNHAAAQDVAVVTQLNKNLKVLTALLKICAIAMSSEGSGKKDMTMVEAK